MNLNTKVVNQTPEWAISQSQQTSNKLNKESPNRNLKNLNQLSANSQNKSNNLSLKIS